MLLLRQFIKAAMVYFTSAFTAYFEGLQANNTKEWFDAHKKQFEKDVKAPFQAFVGDLILALREVVPNLQVEAKDCIFRINRDIRFSADKTPYKTHMSALVSPGGRKAMASLTGVYVEITATQIGVYGGLYMPDKEQLADVRHHIAAHPADFKAAYTNRKFVAAYGTIRGEKNKRLDADLMSVALYEPLILNKQFYYQAVMPAATILHENLIETILQLYADAASVRQFLLEATQ
jgi:uncharacterized protein (TIGR02453 family)